MSGGRLLRDGICDAVLVGGVDCLCRMTVHGFNSLGILSPEGSRPFCRDRAGTHIGEGAGWLLLVRDAPAPLLVRGWGDTSDAHSMAAPHPEGAGLARAMREALAMARLGPGDIDYVNAHGTGTQQNDAAEAQALRDVLGETTPVSSTKGMTGHALGSAGAIELVLLALAMERGFLPPNASSTRAGPAGIEELHVNLVQTTRAAVLRRGLTVSAGFGGSNAAVLLEAA
jgi:3-oxoacyl-[acyl-carrier-protein] synthase-1